MADGETVPGPVQFESLELAIRRFYQKTWADWYGEIAGAVPAALVIAQSDQMTIYRPARDLICLYVTEDQLGQEAADVWPWPTWKVELVHEMLHEWEHK